MKFFISAGSWTNLVLSATILLLGYWIYYLTIVVRRPLLAAPSGPFRRHLRKNLPLLKRKFHPTIWCIEGRAQTLFARLIRTKLIPDIRYRREILTLKDGGQVALDWYESKRLDMSSSPVMVILPGLLGDSQAEYVKCFVLAARSMRMRSVVFNYRGLAGVPLKTPLLYSASSYEDLSEVLNHVKAAEPDARICATGISMGGLILGNYLVNRADESKSLLTAAFAVSVPWNMTKGADSIDQPILNRMLGRHLTGCLCRLVRKYAILSNKKFDWDMVEVLKSRSIREFDSRFTAKNFGYPSVNSYYAQATLHDKLHKIQVPMLCLNAADDPFQPIKAIPIVAAMQSSNVAIVVTSHGGHIGFLEGWWPFTRDQYMCRLFKQFFCAVLFDESNELC